MTSRRGGDAGVRVLGVDPGTRAVGFGIIDIAVAQELSLVDAGALRMPPGPLAPRLGTIFQGLASLIAEHRPQVLAVEEVFHGKNFQSVLKVGQARGVVILAAQLAGLDVCEYSARLVKKSVTGNGNADKAQVQKMVARLLQLDELPEPKDITDAMAVAFCHGKRLWRDGNLNLGKAKKNRVSTAKKSASRKVQDQLAELTRASRGSARASLDRSFLQQLVRDGKATELVKSRSSRRSGSAKRSSKNNSKKSEKE